MNISAANLTLKNTTMTLFVSVLLFLSFNLQAEKVSQIVRANTINKNLAKLFPIEKSFQNVAATFSEPTFLINVLDQSLKLRMTITSTDNQQILVVSAIFDGSMEYDDFAEVYLFEDLSLDKFKVLSDSMIDSKPSIKVIKQSLINDFEDIALFNLTQINSIAPKRAADGIEISVNQLRFIWNN